MAAKKKDKVKQIEKIADKILSMMGTKAKASVSEDSENEAFVVEIDTEAETGLLIGHRGETLNSLQSAIGMIYKQESGDWARIVVNVGDWRQKQEEYLKELALQTAERAKETGEPQILYNLSPAQRRIIHLTLSEDKDIATESQGEDRERYLVVKTAKGSSPAPKA